MINDDFKNTYKFYPNYHGIGSISIFQSLIVNRKKINESFTIYELGIHTKLKGKFEYWYQKSNF